MKFWLRSCSCILFAIALPAMTTLPSAGQGLPELQPEEESSVPMLSPDDLVPQRPVLNEKNTQSESPVVNEGGGAAGRRQIELDRLFGQLKYTANRTEADKISRQIQGLWAQSGSDTVDLLMQSAENAMREEDYVQALDLLDNVVALKPEFAEGWMRRASVHIQMNDMILAMIELNEVLKREPRQYNAIMQLGTVMEMIGHKEEALKAYYQALLFYPQLLRAQKRIGELEEEKTDRAI